MHRNTFFFLMLTTLFSCSSAMPTTTPGVERIGDTTVRFRGTDVEVVLGTLFANSSIGGSWLLLDTAVTGTIGRTVEVARDAIAVRTPSGATIPLATQAAFSDAYGELRAPIARANIASTPVDLYTDRRKCALQYFSAGDKVAMLSVWVDNRTVCSGRLYFAIPGGVQPGLYTLMIDLEEAEVRVPFSLGMTR